MKRLWLATIMCVVGLGPVFGVTSAQAGHDLADILYEKGQITKEEWVRAKADNEKLEAEQRKVRDDQFPVSLRYKDGFYLQSRDGNFEMLIQGRVQLRYSFPQEGDSLVPADAGTADEARPASRPAEVNGLCRGAACVTLHATVIIQ